MATEANPVAPELRDYLRVLRRRKVPLLLTCLVILGGALVASYLQTPVYQAVAEVLLGRRPTESLFDIVALPQNAQRELQTQIRMMKSEAVQSRVREKLGYSPGISARVIGATDIIGVIAESPDRSRVADIANAYANSYVEFRRAQQIDDALAAVGELQRRIADLQLQIDQAQSPLKENLIEQQAVFRGKLEQLQVNATLQTGGAQIVARAVEPDTPIRPRHVRTATLALVLGIVVGVGVAFLIEYLDDSVKDEDDLARASGLSVVGSIPVVRGWKNKSNPRVVSLNDPESHAAEAYRALRTSLQFMSVDRPGALRAIQVTSPNAREGKTTTLANLGVALARAGQSVLIVCCDLRRPRIHQFFGLDNSVGFTSVLLGDASLQDAVQRVPGVDRLLLLASGPLPPNPSELLQSRRAAELLGQLRAQDAFLLIDTPPILPVADAMIVAKRVEGTLFVCSAHKTTRREVSRAVGTMEQVDAPMVGAILNGVKRESSYTYGYYYRGYESAGTRGAGVSGNGNVAHRTKSSAR